jgi:hypothetical protein
MNKVAEEFSRELVKRLQVSIEKEKQFEKEMIAKGLQKRWNKNLKKYVWIKK